MKINSINYNYAQNFGANPNKVFLKYIESKLPPKNQANLVTCRILDQLTEIRNLNGQKALKMCPTTRKIAPIELGDIYLTSIDKSDPITSNLDKVIQCLKGHERYQQMKITNQVKK